MRTIASEPAGGFHKASLSPGLFKSSKLAYEKFPDQSVFSVQMHLYVHAGFKIMKSVWEKINLCTWNLKKQGTYKLSIHILI